MYDAKNAAAVVNDVTNIDTDACLNVSAIKLDNVSARDISEQNDDVDVNGTPDDLTRSDITQCQIFIKINASSAPIPINIYKFINLN